MSRLKCKIAKELISPINQMAIPVASTVPQFTDFLYVELRVIRHPTIKTKQEASEIVV